jgi:hypothetical protein
MVKIFDCFMFSFEEDLLRLRLAEGCDYVYKFIIVEAKQTHTGIDKPLHSDQIKHIFNKYKDKIIHCIVEKFPCDINRYPKGVLSCVPDNELRWNWLREHYQRSIIGNYSVRCDGKDIFIVTDLDEIPNYKKLIYDISVNNNNILNEQINYTLPTYVCNIHYRQEGYNPTWAFTCPARLLNPDNINSMRFYDRKRNLDGYFYHLNRFLKPEQLIKKEESIAESKSTGFSDETSIKNRRKGILRRMLSGNYHGKVTYGDHDMPKNINLLPRFFLFSKEEIDKYLRKLDDNSLDVDDTLNEIMKL